MASVIEREREIDKEREPLITPVVFASHDIM